MVNTAIWERNGRSASCPVWPQHHLLLSCRTPGPTPGHTPGQLHNSSVHKVAVSSSLGHARQFPQGHVPTRRSWTIPEMWLAENRRKSGLFPGGGSCGCHAYTHPGMVSCSGRAQDTGVGTETMWQRWSRRPCSERGGRVEEHKVNLGVSHCYSTTIREQGDITEAGPGRCSQGSSSEPAAE